MGGYLSENIYEELFEYDVQQLYHQALTYQYKTTPNKTIPRIPISWPIT